jgi:hypothetical protein
MSALPKPTERPIWCGVGEAKRLSGLGTTTLYAKLNSGEIRSTKIGAKRLISGRVARKSGCRHAAARTRSDQPATQNRSRRGAQASDPEAKL